MTEAISTPSQPAKADMSNAQLKSMLQRAERRLTDNEMGISRPGEQMLPDFALIARAAAQLSYRIPKLNPSLHPPYITANNAGVARADAQRMLNEHDRVLMNAAVHSKESSIKEKIKESQKHKASNILLSFYLSMTKFVFQCLDGDTSPVLGIVCIHERFIFIVTRSHIQ